MRTKTKNLLGGFAAVLIGLMGIGGFVLRAIDKVRTGHGLDYYFTGYGVQMNYLGALIVIAIAPVALLIGWIIKVWSKGRDDWSINWSDRDREGNANEGVFSNQSRTLGIEKFPSASKNGLFSNPNAFQILSANSLAD